MTRYLTQPVPPDVIIFWRGRFALLTDRLQSPSSAEHAWFWRVQWDILNYLLHRYAGEEFKTPPTPALAPIPAQPLGDSFSDSPEAPEEFFSERTFTGPGKPPRARSLLRPLL